MLADLRANRPDCTSSEANDVVLSRLGQSSFDLDFSIVALDLAGSIAEALGGQCKSVLSQVFFFLFFVFPFLFSFIPCF